MGGFCDTTAKIILFVFNFIFFVCGLVVLICGILIATGRLSLLPNAISGELIGTAGSSAKAMGIFLCLLGAFTFIVGFCGCWGAMKENTCLLRTYAGIIITLVIIEFVMAILIATVGMNAINKGAKKAFKELKSMDKVKSIKDESFAVHLSQIFLECCGVDSPLDYKNSSHFKTQLPLSCCKPKEKKNEVFKKLSKDVKTWKNSSAVNGYFKDISQCKSSTSGKFNNIGCSKALGKSVASLRVPFIIALVIIGLIEGVGIFSACLLARNIDHPSPS